jgi:two-component system, LytTR family, sensor kinase
MAWTWPRIERRGALVWLAAIVALGLWQGNTVWFAMQADGEAMPWSRPYLWELTGALAAYAVSWIPLATATNAPRPAGRWPRFVAIHAAGYLAFTALHTGLMLGVRFPLYRALGWGRYDYGGGSTAFRLAMEASKDVVVYLLLTGGFGLLAAWRDGQRRALRDARIATELRDAQLRALVGQLNPHFLFNALNTISAVMYSDLARTDRLLADLGDMLRAGLTGDAGPTWSLTDERTHTERFLSVMLARFGDRLQVRWCVDDAARAAQVPRFTLQLLVENAIKHNQDARQPLEIAISARRAADRVELEVADNGRGFGASPDPGAAGPGTGLATLRRALELCHGPAAALELATASGGGACVRLSLPAERAA